MAKKWESSRVLSHYASPVVVGRHVLYSNNVGVLSALRTDDGSVTARARAGGPCMATPLVVGTRIYLFQEDGTATVYRVGDQLRELATNHLWEQPTTPIAATDSPSSKEAVGAHSNKASDESLGQSNTVYGIAASDGSILIRTGTRLFCVRKLQSQSE